MSANERTEEHLRHERLCAYLFGELDARDRAAVEAELARDPELAAEHERLAATIALVRDAVPAEDALSSEARAELTAAAARKAGGTLAPVLPWPVRVARSPLTAAAAVLAMLGVFAAIGLNEDAPAPAGGRPGDAIARVDRQVVEGDERVPTLAARRSREKGPAEAAKEEADAAPARLGLPDEARPADEPPSPPPADGGTASLDETEAAGAEAEDARGKVVIWKVEIAAEGPIPPLDLPQADAGTRSAGRAAELDGLGYGGSSKAPGLPTDATRSRMESLGYMGGEGGGVDAGSDTASPAVGEKKRTDQIGGIDLNTFGAPGSDPRFDPNAPVRTGASAGPGSPGPSGPTVPAPVVLRAGATQTGNDAWYLGQGQRAAGGDEDRVGRLKQPASTSAGVPIQSLGELLTFEDEQPATSRRGIQRNADAAEDLLAKGHLPDEEAESLRERIERQRREDWVRGIDRCAPDDVIRFCRIRPYESPAAMFFRCWGDNPFEYAALDPVSTFAADVDTASYALARNYLARGYMPTKEQVRTEEFVNAFASGVAPPHEDVFRIDLEMAPSPFSGPSRPDAWMLRVVVAGKEVDRAERPPLALTFVVDVSGSMKQGNRIELVKHALRLLIGQLDSNDAVAIVAFSNEARLVLPMTSAAAKAVIESALFGLSPDGSTNAEAGLMLGYAQAAQGLTPGATNRVVMLSDGVANVGNTDEATLLANVASFRSKGIYLNTIGVGMGNHNDALLEQLADKGDGICSYVDTADEARKVLVDGFTGQFTPIARDVKIQVELDPAQVESYRLLGYENRAIADAQFRDDTVDAGEVGAGHQVTALYEIVRAPGATNDGPLAVARVRFKPPFAIDRARTDAESRAAAETAREIERGIAFREVATSFRGASVGFQRAALVAQLAELLRRSVHARGDSYDALVTEAIRLEQIAEDPAFTQLTTMLAASRELIVRHLPPDDAVARAIDELTRHNYLQGKMAQLEAGNRELTEEVLAELQRQNAALEARIRELLER
jgi:Ca-activated chloride channel family protein